MKHIEVISIDRIGLVGEISKIIRRMNGNIITHNADVVTEGGQTLSRFRAEVEFGADFDAEAAFRRLRKISNVIQVRITDI